MVHLCRVFNLYNHNRAGEITVDELGPVLDTLGLDVDCAGLAAIVGAYVPNGTMSLHFEDFDKLHCALGGWSCGGEKIEFQAVSSELKPGLAARVMADQRRPARTAWWLYADTGPPYHATKNMVVDLQHEVYFLNNQLHPILDEEEEDLEMSIEDDDWEEEEVVPVDEGEALSNLDSDHADV
ncbi:uncharacterized protein [Miscanthus floridulus]|uniref:uncharacterized protein n=1 Tax=Miscanthus floridulus TaxID=154761 RepID=UPI0034576F02